MDEVGSKHNVQYKGIRESYGNWKVRWEKEGGYLYYNLVEEELIGRKGKENLQELTTAIRALAVQLERINPVEWNNLLTAATYEQ